VQIEALEVRLRGPRDVTAAVSRSSLSMAIDLVDLHTREQSIAKLGATTGEVLELRPAIAGADDRPRRLRLISVAGALRLPRSGRPTP